jgi:hypothetical protein
LDGIEEKTDADDKPNWNLKVNKKFGYKKPVAISMKVLKWKMALANSYILFDFCHLK